MYVDKPQYLLSKKDNMVVQVIIDRSIWVYEIASLIANIVLLFLFPLLINFNGFIVPYSNATNSTLKIIYYISMGIYIIMCMFNIFYIALTMGRGEFKEINASIYIAISTFCYLASGVFHVISFIMHINDDVVHASGKVTENNRTAILIINIIGAVISLGLIIGNIIMLIKHWNLSNAKPLPEVAKKELLTKTAQPSSPSSPSSPSLILTCANIGT